MTESFPLRWPAGWPRTPSHRRMYPSAFRVEYVRCRSHLYRELDRFGASGIVVSSNLRPDHNPARVDMVDPGVAIYFNLDGRQMVMAQDRYVSVYGNLRAATLAIEGLRQMERHGGAHMVARAFDGFAALPGPAPFDWRHELDPSGMPITTLEHAQRAYRARAKQVHPDVPGGSAEAMALLNRAIQAARDELNVMPPGAI